MSRAGEGAIAFTDLVGFTEFTATRGDDEALAVLGVQERIVRAALPEGGRVVKELGDGLLLFLPDAVTAIATCLDVLAGFDRAGAVDEMPLWVRAGLHWGCPSRRGDDLIGHDVNVTARIVDVAGPGELLCSGAMVRATGAPPGIDVGAIGFVELGPVVMKGIPEPVDLYRAERVEVSPPA